jgi:hypothetical protein
VRAHAVSVVDGEVFVTLSAAAPNRPPTGTPVEGIS